MVSGNSLILESNIIRNNSQGIILDSSAGNSTLINNTFVGNSLYSIVDRSGNVNINKLVYNNSDGEVRWIDEANNGFLKNLTLLGDIGNEINLTIANNSVSLNLPSFGVGLINSSANITLFVINISGWANNFTIGSDAIAPAIAFGVGVENHLEFGDDFNIFVNLSVDDYNEDSV